MAGWPRIAAPALGLALAPCPAVAAPEAAFVRPPAVLLLDPGEASRPGFLPFLEGFRERLREVVADSPVTVHTVNMDLGSLSSPVAAATLDALVRERFGAEPLGVVVAFRDQTFEAALAWRREIWPRAAVVAVADTEATARRGLGEPACSVLRLPTTVAPTMEAAVALLPRTERVVLVGGTELQASSGALRSEIAGAAGREVVSLLGLPVDELRARVAALPERSLVFFAGLTVDGRGRRFVPADALDLVAARANAPVFVNAAAFVGRGVVGGAVVDFEIVGRAAADGVLSRLRGGPSPGVQEIPATRLLFDGRELDRWKLADRALPPGSEVLYRSPTLWQEYRARVVVLLAVATAQTIAIGTLLLHRRRRREAEERLRRLSTRLMTAQEDERRRIARDLHDDVCQRLVLLAVDLDLLGDAAEDEGGAGRDAGGRAPGGRAPGEIAESARALSADVQRIAYRLHPASLDRLGLVHAAQRFAREATSHTDLRVETVIVDWPAPELPPDVALALYRVVQEALRNVVRHSGASYARVAFRGGRGGVTVRIEDDGAGFDPMLVEDAGLGLTSMRERLQIHGGRLNVVSAPGNGTVVEAWVPAGAFAAPAAASSEAPT